MHHAPCRGPHFDSLDHRMELMREVIGPYGAGTPPSNQQIDQLNNVPRLKYHFTCSIFYQLFFEHPTIQVSQWDPELNIAALNSKIITAIGVAINTYLGYLQNWFYFHTACYCSCCALMNCFHLRPLPCDPEHFTDDVPMSTKGVFKLSLSLSVSVII